MKKHSEWRKGRRIFRRVMRAAAAIDRKDTARAEWFNNLFDRLKEDPMWGQDCTWYIASGNRTSEWPDVTDMFVEVTEHEYMDDLCLPGEYRVDRVSYSGTYDMLLNVSNVGTKEEELLWFPRHGQTIIPCKEYI